MSSPTDLRQAERRAFRTAFQDGLWDILVGCFVLMFAIGPLLSEIGMGDFWSSAVFLPLWALVYLGIYLVRKHVVAPRSGVVNFGPARKARLLRFNIVIFVVLLVGLALGVLSAVHFGSPGWVHTARFGLIVLLSFAVAAFFLDFPRLYIYGLMLALAPFVGEWLYQRMGAAHHGYPIVFGAATGIILLAGLAQFVRFLRNNPLPPEESFPEEG
jgi:hypothetical protein